MILKRLGRLILLVLVVVLGFGPVAGGGAPSERVSGPRGLAPDAIAPGLDTSLSEPLRAFEKAVVKIAQSWGQATLNFSRELLGSSAIVGPPRVPETPGSRLLAEESHGVPFSFVENRGQWEVPSRFVVQRRHYRIHLLEGGVTLQVLGDRFRGERKVHNIALEFLGSEGSEARLPFGRKEQRGKFNFLRGRDESDWQRGVRGFDQVVYPSVWDGIDVVFREQDGSLEYDLVLAPEADLGQVSLRVRGIESLDLDRHGDLWIRTSVGEIRQKKPTTWYELPSGEKVPVVCEYVVLGPDRFTFRIPDRNDDWKVVIDPGLIWSTFLGGVNDEYAYDATVLPSGAVLLLGETDSIDFPVTPGVVKSTLSGLTDISITCVHADASALVFSSFLGGNRRDRPCTLQIDSSGDLILVGETNSDDLPSTSGSFSPSRTGGFDGFLARVSGDGSAVEYLTYLGGSDDERIIGMDIASDGDVVVIGETRSSDYPTSIGALSTSNNGAMDAFVSRIDLAGGGLTDLVYSTYLGSVRYDSATAVVLDSSDRAIVAGTTHSPGFFTTAGAYQSTYVGKGDAFLSRLASDGSALDYSTFLGSSGFEEINAIQLEPSGDVVLAGTTTGSDFPSTLGVFQPVHSGSNDVVVARMNLGGQGSADLIWSTFLGGSDVEYVFGLRVDSTGAPTIVGQTQSGDFDVTPIGGVDPISMDDWDGYVTRLSPDGTSLLYSNFINSDGWDMAFGVALAGLETVVIVGETTPSPNFTTTAGVLSTSRVGGVYEVFLRMIGIEQDVTLELLPRDRTVNAGSTLLYDIMASNNTASVQPITAELNVFLPDGSPDSGNPILSRAKNLPASLMVTRTGRYRVPASTPPGLYTIRGSIIRGSDVLTLSSLVFEVVE